MKGSEMEKWETDNDFHKWYASGSWARRPHTERKMVEVEILSISSYSDFGSIEDFLAAVQKARDAVPEEYRASSRVFGEPDCYDSDWRFRAYYVRPATDDEWLADMRWSYEKFLEDETRDKLDYERLKHKFG
jgi:hypothetical protein